MYYLNLIDKGYGAVCVMNVKNAIRVEILARITTTGRVRFRTRVGYGIGYGTGLILGLRLELEVYHIIRVLG